MKLILIIAGIGLIFLSLAYAYWKSHRRFKQFKHQTHTTQSELEKLLLDHERIKQELSLTQTKLNHAISDPVTHLLGWQLFEDRLAQNIKESARYQFTMGILFVDIDDFKVINNALGYEMGDALLAEVAKRLQTCIRKVDSLSRFAEDTFVILLTQLAKPETAAIVAQRILQALVEPFLVNGSELYITACVGISIYPTDEQDATALLRSADHALHLAKEKGNQHYQFYQARMHAQSQRELMLYTSLSRESILNEFVLYYQPILNVKSETIICMDALLHWQHPEFGLIKPQEVYALAERQCKMNIISEGLLRNAGKQFLHWHSLGFNPTFLGIPLSIKQLENSHFIYRISQILQELGIKPTSILLEIKENNSEMPFEALEKSFNMLKYLGVKIAIDDFGSGLFSLRHLKNFAINYLKLDSALVECIDSNDNQQAIALLKSIIFLAKSMSMEVIIQGIESEQQVALLKELGCSLMQGQFLGGPLSEQEVNTKMASLMHQ